MTTPRFNFPHDATKPASGVVDAAASDNESRFYRETVLRRLHLVVCRITMIFSESHLEAFGRFDLLLDEALVREGYGQWDALQKGNPFAVYFLLRRRVLNEASEFVLEKLKEFNLLEICTVSLAEVEAWRTIHAPAGGPI